jgi:hypothetical protein
VSENLLAWLFLALTCGYIPTLGPQGFAVHRKSPQRCGFLTDRTSVRVVSGSGPAASETALRITQPAFVSPAVWFTKT